MKNYFEAVIQAGRESNNEGFINWLIIKLDHEQMDILQRAAVIYAEQSNSHKPVVMQAEGSASAEGATVGQRSVDTGVRVRNKSGDENCEDCTYPNCFCGG
jgi:hypothetical protein